MFFSALGVAGGAGGCHNDTYFLGFLMRTKWDDVGDKRDCVQGEHQSAGS